MKRYAIIPLYTLFLLCVSQTYSMKRARPYEEEPIKQQPAKKQRTITLEKEFKLQLPEKLQLPREIWIKEVFAELVQKAENPEDLRESILRFRLIHPYFNEIVTNYYLPKNNEALQKFAEEIEDWILVNEDDPKLYLEELFRTLSSFSNDNDWLLAVFTPQYLMSLFSKFDLIESINKLRSAVIQTYALNKVCMQLFTRLTTDDESFAHELPEEQLKSQKLIHAAAQGKESDVYALLDEGVNVDTPHILTLITPLHAAAFCNHPEIVAYLIERGANINLQSDDEKTASHFAVKGSSFKILEDLMQYNANPNIKDTNNHTPLYLATLFNNLSAVSLLLANNANPNLKSHDGNTPLHEASEKGFGAIVEQLIFYDAEKNSTNDTLETPLHLAAQKGHVEICMQLITNNNASINLERSDGKIPLHLAAQNGHINIIRLMIPRGAHINKTDTNGDTALHYAVRKKKSNVVEYLLQNDANPNTHNNIGETPLEIALKLNSEENVKHLVNSGADINTPDPENDQKTLFHLAAEMGHPDIIQYLIENGANIYAQTEDESLPIHTAAAEGNIKAVSVFLEKDPNLLSAENEFNETPLLTAAEHGQTDLIKDLLDRGADVEHKNNAGETALHLAAQEDHEDSVKILLDHSPDRKIVINTLDSIGYNPEVGPEVEQLLRNYLKPSFLQKK